MKGFANVTWALSLLFVLGCAGASHRKATLPDAPEPGLYKLDGKSFLRQLIAASERSGSKPFPDNERNIFASAEGWLLLDSRVDPMLIAWIERRLRGWPLALSRQFESFRLQGKARREKGTKALCKALGPRQVRCYVEIDDLAGPQLTADFYRKRQPAIADGVYDLFLAKSEQQRQKERDELAKDLVDAFTTLEQAQFLAAEMQRGHTLVVYGREAIAFGPVAQGGELTKNVPNDMAKVLPNKNGFVLKWRQLETLPSGPDLRCTRDRKGYICRGYKHQVYLRSKR